MTIDRDIAQLDSTLCDPCADPFVISKEDIAAWGRVKAALQERNAQPAGEASIRGDAVTVSHQVGEVPGHGWPDFPEEFTEFRERLAYQRGVADARYISTQLSQPAGEAVVDILPGMWDRADPLLAAQQQGDHHGD